MNEEIHNRINDTQIVDTTSNPAPLGLCAFGMTTVLLNIHNIGFTELDSMILGMGIFFGGFGQILAGLMEFKKNNTFGTTAFTAYGVFWLTLVTLIILPKMGVIEHPSQIAMGFYLTIWGLFTLMLFIGTFRISKALQFVFGSLTVLFFLLALGDFTGNPIFTQIAGYEGIICGLIAIYTGLAQVLNELYYKEVFPLGIVKN
ncbi:GPR1/FUN34/YaaH family transporter [Arcobacter sp. LA11]|uniref:acetate uptake transporter n=1 Tax=Arcobacter sp. LA11 TaxID=1898176 RepID=UPI0009331788|nr:GPR1/FUN34/YaaH family transporter [Arcobacter sp. LA11]